MDEFIAQNRDLWDAWTRIHVGSEFYDVASFRSGERPIRIKPFELEELGSVEGRSLLHLQCHFGLDTLSWARMGATVTGADLSPASIEAARALAEELGIPATFVCANLYDLPAVLDAEEGFDVVYTSHGVLGWLPDIEGWARVVAHFLKPGGTFYLAEGHPVAMVFDDEGVAPGELRLRYPYWSHEEPISLPAQGSYADREAPTDGLVEHGWDHSLGEIVTALADVGLRIEFLHEFPSSNWQLPFTVPGPDGFRLPGELDGRLPLSFSLKATKPARSQS
jgi:SAM-dependent methyltransferase